MNIRTMTMTAGCVLVGGLVLAGCSSTGSSNAAGSNSTAQAGGTASAGAANAVSSPTAGSGSTAGSGGSNGGSTAGTGNGGSGAATCQAAGLKISLSGSNNVSSQVIQWVQLSNTTSTACTMDGFAGVDLVGTANGQSNYSWPLVRDNDSYSKVTLNPGEAAYFGIRYLPWAASDGAAGAQEINVDKIELTPPNTTTTVTLSFSANIELQDSATHPGTYLMPISESDGS